MTGKQDTENLKVIQNTHWHKLVDVLWVILFIVSIGILIASLPSYARHISNVQFNTVEASPAFVKAMRIASVLASIATACLCLVLSAILFWRKRDEAMATFASFFLLGYGIIMAGPLEALNAFQPGEFTSLVYSIQSALIITPIMLIFCLFPNGRFVPHWTRFAVLASLVYIPLGFSLTQADLFSFKNPLTALVGFGYFVFIPLGLYAQVFRYRRVSTLQERQQTKWFVYGLALWLALGILVSIPYVVLQNLPMGAPQPWWSLLSQLGWFITLMVLPLSLAIAVMRYRLWDVDLLINRTLVYGALTAIIIGIYILLVGGFSQLFQSSGNLFVSLLATGLIAVLFQPLRERLQRAINRMVYGERDNPISVLTKLGERLEATVAPEFILPTIAESISQALRLPYVAVMLKEGTEFVLAADCGQKPASLLTCERLPLNYRGEPIGLILVSRRAGEDSFTSDEKTLLQNIARQVGVAAYAIQLTRDLQRSRERLVTAREEERRRLRRDLHDGLGPTLASQTLTLEAVEKLVTRDPAQVVALIKNMKIQSEGAVREIRSIINDLRPSILDNMGLVEALREGAAHPGNNATAIHLNIEDGLPKLSAAMELAVYRISMEALTNVMRHARAQNCYLHLWMDHGLKLEIADDGVGLPEEFHAGVGLSSIRERAEELGGDCSFEKFSPHGARILVHLPLVKETI